ncbi:hypothetical protein [Pedobacter arcticus]|uniref:hypothetical protein n=1 Tax=Pedobacter arcticus TaxID=752140 RepID=UPI0002E5B749|nr:hypothetical protein [Pedobacter arcticus]
MNLEESRIKSSRRDPEFSVFEVNGKIIRFVNPDQEEILENLNQKSKSFPEVLKYQPENFEHTGYFEIEKIPFIVLPYELPFQLYKDYALFYLRCLERLLAKDFALKDATPFNIAYTGENRLLHFDIGSIEKYDSTTGWKAYRQFLSEFYFPLIYLKENGGIYGADLVKLQFDQQWIHHYKFRWNNYLKPGFNIHYVFYKKSRIRKLENKTREISIKVSKQQVINNIALLKAEINTFNPPKQKTKWDDYYSQTVLRDGYVAKKEEIVEDFLKKVNSEFDVIYATDWGANDGKFSVLLLNVFKKAIVLSVESDYNAVNQLYVRYKAKRIIPIYADILNLTPNLGFDGERESLKSRLNKVNDFQLCLGLIHHLIHQENLSFETIIDFFAGCAKPKSYLLIEFINDEDPRHQLIKNPNYPYSLSRDYFVKSINKHYEILDAKQVISTRELFICFKRG